MTSHLSRAPHGARGLKRGAPALPGVRSCRAPHGARGLKRHKRLRRPAEQRSRPTRGAWIETENHGGGWHMTESRPTRGAWIETQNLSRYYCKLTSHPAWGAWIETEKLGGRIVKSSATFPYRMLFHLGLKKTTALCQNWVREWQCREECSNGKLGAVRGNRGISYGKLTGGRCLHEFCGERYY